MYDAIIVGAGVAGLTAAIYLGRAGKSVLLLESKSYGGQIVNSPHISNYPGYKDISGFELVHMMYEQALSFGCIYKNEEVIKVENAAEVITKQNRYQGTTIILATGLRKRPLGLYAEADFVGKGVSYCATCDGNFFKGKNVAVVGAGNTALEDAHYLANLANQVYLIHRSNQFRGEESTLKNLQSRENVRIITNANVIALNGEEKLTSITLQVEGNEQDLDIDGLFIAIGQIPDNLRFSNIVELDEDGYVISANCETKFKNIFVAGDTREKELRQLITAASDGSIAATKAIQFLNNK